MEEALAQLEGLVADYERGLGPNHVDTLRTRRNLAWSLSRAGPLDDALEQTQALVADCERLLGWDHP